MPGVPITNEWRLLKDQFDVLVHGEGVHEDNIEMYFDDQIRRRFSEWIARAAVRTTKTDSDT